MVNESSAQKKTEKSVDELSGTGVSNEQPIRWEAPSFIYYKKSWQWSLGVIILGIAVGIGFILAVNYSAAAVAVAATIVFVTQSRQRPDLVTYQIDGEGIKIGERLLPWRELKSFWIVERNSGSYLYLETTARLLPVQTIHLENIEPSAVRVRLATHLPERTTGGEQLADTFIRLLRF